MMTSVEKKENGDQVTVKPKKFSEDKKGKAFSKIKMIKSMAKRCPWKRMMFLVILIGISFLAGLSVRTSGYGKKTEQAPPVKMFPILNDHTISFDAFVVPFDKENKLTYMSLSISIRWPNKELRDEMIEKKRRLRGIIYDVLIDKMIQIKDVASLRSLKDTIKGNVNRILTKGRVEEITVNGFSVV